MLADLHMHSTVSDGWKDPDEVAHLAADGGVQVMALSDHDSFYGVLRARRTAHGRGLGYVTAIEITTYPPLQFRHILGHGVDMQNPVLRSLIGRNQAIAASTGFLAPCAQSFWTVDSGSYWSFSSDSAGSCTSIANSTNSDLPDGGVVEKGGAGEVLRRGNNPAAVAPFTVSRTVYVPGTTRGPTGSPAHSTIP